MQLSSLSRLSVLTVVGIAAVARGDINGFGNFSAFTINQSDDRPTPGVGNGWIRLTNRGDNERRSIFANTAQSVGEFTASFTYRAVGSPEIATDFGTCFVIQNSASRAAALGTDDFGFAGINRSVALSLELIPLRLPTMSGVYTAGAGIGDGGTATDPVDLYSGHEIDVVMHYSNRILSTSLRDRVTGAVFETGTFIDIAAAIGSPTAYIGFTAGTGTWANADQYVSNFSYSVPAPGCLGLMAAAGICALRRRGR